MQRLLQIDLLLVGNCDQYEHDVGQLEREVLLGLTRLLRLAAIPVVQLTRKLTNLFYQSREIRERRPIPFLELADVGINCALCFRDGQRLCHAASSRTTESISASVL